MDSTTHDDRRGAPASKRHARAARWLRLVAVAATLALGPLGCGKPAPPSGSAPAKVRAQAREIQPSRRGDGLNEATAQFMAFALSALLVPLFDDDLPPRWADPSLSFDCEAGTVTVDDAPLDVGAPVPDEPFTVRWHMERCAPFDDAMQLSGDIELKVEPSDTGYRAVVQPVQFHIVSARGYDVLTEPFTARMGLGR